MNENTGLRRERQIMLGLFLLFLNLLQITDVIRTHRNIILIVFNNKTTQAKQSEYSNMPKIPKNVNRKRKYYWKQTTREIITFVPLKYVFSDIEIHHDDRTKK